MLSVLTQQEIREAWERAEENFRSLNNCRQHKFNKPPETGVGIKLRCLACDGEMSLLNVMYYIRGYEAAGANPNEIMMGISNVLRKSRAIPEMDCVERPEGDPAVRRAEAEVSQQSDTSDVGGLDS